MKIEYVPFIYIAIGFVYFIFQAIKIGIRLLKNGFETTYLECMGRKYEHMFGGEDSPADLFLIPAFSGLIWPVVLYFYFFCGDEISGKTSP